MSNPLVVAVIVNWNRVSDTLDCIDSLLNQEYQNLKIVLIDSGSDEQVYDQLKNSIKNLTNLDIIHFKTNIGYAKGANEGIMIALKYEPKYILLINNDAILKKGSLINLVKISNTNNNIGFVSGKVYFHNSRIIQSVGKLFSFYKGEMIHIGAGLIDNGQYDEIKERNWIDHIYVLINVDLIKTIGCYDSNYFMYYEDADWCIRAKAANFKIIYTPEAISYHKVSASSGNWVNPFNTYYMSRNIYRFIAKWATKKEMIIFLTYQLLFGFFLKLVILIKNRDFNCILPLIIANRDGLILLINHLQ